MARLLPARSRAWHILLTYGTAVLIAAIIGALGSEFLLYGGYALWDGGFPLWYVRRVGALIALYFSVLPGAILILVLLFGIRGRVAWGIALSPPVLVILFGAIEWP